MRKASKIVKSIFITILAFILGVILFPFILFFACLELFNELLKDDDDLEIDEDEDDAADDDFIDGMEPWLNEDIDD